MAEEKKPNRYGTGNIYLDAAIDALKQSSEKDKNINFVLLIGKGKHIYMTRNADSNTLAGLFAQSAQDKIIRHALMKACAGIHIYHSNSDGFLSEFTDTMEKFNKELGELGKKYGIEPDEDE